MSQSQEGFDSYQRLILGTKHLILGLILAKFVNVSVSRFKVSVSRK